MTPEQLLGLLALLADLRNQLALVTNERDEYAQELVQMRADASAEN